MTDLIPPQPDPTTMLLDDLLKRVTELTIMKDEAYIVHNIKRNAAKTAESDLATAESDLATANDTWRKYAEVAIQRLGAEL